MSQQDTHIQLGTIQGVFGIKGWLKIFSFFRPKEQILDYTKWQLRKPGNASVYKLQEGKLQGNKVVAKLNNIDDRTLAESLVRSEIWVAKSELPDLDDNEFYWFQLKGLTVITMDGEQLGRVKKMMETGANDVIVVQDEIDKEEILIPYVREQVVKRVDLEKKTIMVDWQKDY